MFILLFSVFKMLLLIAQNSLSFLFLFFIFLKLKAPVPLLIHMQAVQEYYIRVKNTDSDVCGDDNSLKVLDFPAENEVSAFDDGSVVLVSECDLDGYDESIESGLTRNEVLVDLNLACRGVQVARQAAISRLSYLWLRYHSTTQKLSTKKLGSIGVDIHVY